MPPCSELQQRARTGVFHAQTLRAVLLPPTGLIRSVRERLDVLERDLAAARSALADAETELLTEQQRLTPRPVALTTTQVAELLGLPRTTVTVMISPNELASVKVGGSRRVVRRDLDAYLASITVGGAA